MNEDNIKFDKCVGALPVCHNYTLLHQIFENIESFELFSISVNLNKN